jgi:hypothetical protein
MGIEIEGEEMMREEIEEGAEARAEKETTTEIEIEAKAAVEVEAEIEMINEVAVRERTQMEIRKIL